MKKSVYKKASTSKTGKPAKMMMGGMPKKKKDSDMSMMMGGMPKKKKAYGTSMMMGGMAKNKAYKKKMQDGGMSTSDKLMKTPEESQYTPRENWPGYGSFPDAAPKKNLSGKSLMKRNPSPKKKMSNRISFAKNGGTAKNKKMQDGGMSAFGTTKANTTSNPGSLMKRTTSPKKKVTNLVSFAKNGGMAKKKKY